MDHQVFRSRSGIEEHFFALTSTPSADGDFHAEAVRLLDRYRTCCREAGCDDASTILLRFHLSDVTNQALKLKELLPGNLFVSIVGQPPAGGARLALEAWHCRGERPFRAHFARLERFVPGDSFAQTEAEFEHLKKELAAFHTRVADATARTWLYCRDVDTHYAGLVKGRNEFFFRNGLTADTHFIASTGIGAELADVKQLVAMESLSYPGIGQERFHYLSAPEFLSPTQLYGVAFERGVRIDFDDCAHLYISGTASIDNQGQVLHLGDVRLQTRRMVRNIAALLEAGGASLADVCWGTVYLRDLADAELVRGELASLFPEAFPLVILRAPVCRPTWLVEMECVALKN